MTATEQLENLFDVVSAEGNNETYVKEMISQLQTFFANGGSLQRDFIFEEVKKLHDGLLPLFITDKLLNQQKE